MIIIATAILTFFYLKYVIIYRNLSQLRFLNLVSCIFSAVSSFSFVVSGQEGVFVLFHFGPSGETHCDRSVSLILIFLYLFYPISDFFFSLLIKDRFLSGNLGRLQRPSSIVSFFSPFFCRRG